MTATVNDDLLRPTVCPRCEYALDGLPAGGVCPECGRRCGDDVCLFGFDYSGHLWPWTSRPPDALSLAIYWMALSLGCGVFGYAWWTQSPFGSRQWGLVAIPAFACGSIVMVRWDRRGWTKNRVLIRFASVGLSRVARGWGPIPYEAIDRVPLIPWSGVCQLMVQDEGNGYIRIIVFRVRTFWTLRHVPIDVIAFCPPTMAEALQELVAEWRAAADRR